MLITHIVSYFPVVRRLSLVVHHSQFIPCIGNRVEQEGWKDYVSFYYEIRHSLCMDKA